MSNERTELQIVRQQLAEAHATLDAIRRGEVDAVMVHDGDRSEVFTLESADLPYREFLEQMGEGAVSLDDRGTVLYCNRFVCDLLSITREDLIGLRLSSLLDAPSVPAFEQALVSASRSELVGVLTACSGSSVPVSLSVTPVIGRPRINVVVSDQRIRRSLQNVSAERDAAEAASSAKDRFLAVLGHELRNPLAALSSSVEVLARGRLEGEQRDAVYASMSRQLGQLRMLVDDLLDLSRIAEGKIVLKKAVFPIAELVQHATEQVAGLIESRGHTLVAEAIPGDLRIEADRTRVEQLIVNLLSNAAKYTPPGGRIELAVRPVQGALHVMVRDNGIGLAPADQQRIFEAFAQVAEGTDGLGIGLALVRQLAELHGGRVRAESEGRGRGATFWLELPIGDIAHAPAAGAPARLPLPKDLRVLVVDDNEDAATMLSMLLETEGVQSEAVHRGAEVLPAVERVRPQLLLLDLGLPDISGYEVAERLRQAGHGELMIVALTGFSHDSARARVRAAGFDAHAVKPLSITQLRQLLETAGGRVRR